MTTVPAWHRPALVTAILTALTLAFMSVTSMGPNVVLVIGSGAAVGASAWLLSLVGRTAGLAIPWVTTIARQPEQAGTGSLDRGWRYRIPAGPRDDRTAFRLHQTLVEILDQRLKARHGVDRHADPAAARAIIGDDLAAFADDPEAAASLMRLRTVGRIVSLIEQI